LYISVQVPVISHQKKIMRTTLFFFTQPDNKDVYPLEFNFFVDKKMLFKVEVSDGNVNRKWRNYGVKKATDDVEIIDEFIKKYSSKVIIF